MLLSLFVPELQKLSEKDIYFVVILHKLINNLYSLISKFNAVAVILVYKPAICKTSKCLAYTGTGNIKVIRNCNTPYFFSGMPELINCYKIFNLSAAKIQKRPSLFVGIYKIPVSFKIYYTRNYCENCRNPYH